MPTYQLLCGPSCASIRLAWHDLTFADQGAAEAKEGSDAKEGLETIKARTETEKAEAISEASTSKVSSVGSATVAQLLQSFAKIHKLQVD